MHYARRNADNLPCTFIYTKNQQDKSTDHGKLCVGWDKSNLQKPPQCIADPCKLQKLGWLAQVPERSAVIYLNLVVHLRKTYECNCYAQKLNTLMGFNKRNLPGPGEISIPRGFILQEIKERNIISRVIIWHNHFSWNRKKLNHNGTCAQRTILLYFLYGKFIIAVHLKI